MKDSQPRQIDLDAAMVAYLEEMAKNRCRTPARPCVA